MAKPTDKTKQNPGKPAPKADPMGARPKHIQEENVQAPKDDTEFFPKLKVIQGLSPEIVKGDEKYIPGAAPGQLLLTTTPARLIEGEDGIHVVLLECRKRYVEYTPRSQGGGFVASYDSREEMEGKFTKGNDMQTTIDYLCVDADTMTDDEPVVFVLSLDTISKMAVARKIAGYVETYKTLSGVKYHVTAVQARNKKNQPYHNFAIEAAGWLGKPEYNLVLEHQAVNSPKFLPEGTGSVNSEI